MPGLDPSQFEVVSAPSAGGGGMDPSQFEVVGQAGEQPPKAAVTDAFGHERKPTALTAAESKFSSWVPGGSFIDEIAGWIDAAVEEKTLSPSAEGYRKHRDAYRQVNKQAVEEHPTAAKVGTAAGIAFNLLPGARAGKMAEGVSLGRAALKGGAQGAAYALGESEADLTKNEFGQAALDTAMGFGVGAGAGAIGNRLGEWLRRAPVRQEAKELAGLKEGLQYSTKVKTFGKATPTAPEGQFVESIKKELRAEPAIAKAAQKSPGKAMQLVDAHVSKLTDNLDAIYDTAQTASKGAPLKATVRALEKVKDRFEKTTATKPLAQQVQSTIDGLVENWGKAGAEGEIRGRIPFQSLREEYRAWQDVANRANKVFSSQSPREEVAESMANAMREVLHKHVDKVAQQNPDLGISRRVLEQTNQKVSTWLKVQRALTEKATREAHNMTTMGDVLGMAKDALSHPLRTGVKAAGAVAGPAAERIVDPRLAALSQMAARGDRRAAGLLQFIQGAPQKLGPRAAAQTAMAGEQALTGPATPPEEGEEPEQPVAATP